MGGESCVGLFYCEYSIISVSLKPVTKALEVLYPFILYIYITKEIRKNRDKGWNFVKTCFQLECWFSLQSRRDTRPLPISCHNKWHKEEFIVYIGFKFIIKDTAYILQRKKLSKEDNLWLAPVSSPPPANTVRPYYLPTISLILSSVLSYPAPPPLPQQTKRKIAIWAQLVNVYGDQESIPTIRFRQPM